MNVFFKKEEMAMKLAVIVAILGLLMIQGFHFVAHRQMHEQTQRTVHAMNSIKDLVNRQDSIAAILPPGEVKND